MTRTTAILWLGLIGMLLVNDCIARRVAKKARLSERGSIGSQASFRLCGSLKISSRNRGRFGAGNAS
jgi:hypothetical protein